MNLWQYSRRFMKQTDKYLIVIAGPTGVGKTTVSLQLAKQFNTDIINADSRQIYVELNKGTAKPGREELTSATHHFVNHISIQDPFTAADFEEQALAVAETVFGSHQTLIVSGGTAFYIRALLEGFDAIPDVNPSFVQELNEQHAAEGLQSLQAELLSVDPAYYNTIDIQNPRRIIRALSVWRAHQVKFSSLLEEKKPKRDFTPIKIFLNRDRQELYERINHRVDLMIENGLLDEVKELYEHRNLQALQTVGYQELFEYLDDHSDLSSAIELIKRNSRRYAKRQLTWYRNREGWESFHPKEILKISEYIRQQIIAK